MKEIFRKFTGSFEHWLINPDGTVIDAFKGLTTIFECHPEEFFEYMTKDNDAQNDGEYNKMLTDYCYRVEFPEFEYSNIYAIKNVVERIPSGSVLNLSINDAIRITNFFRLQPNVKTYANIGTHGIDGCLSSLLGQSMGTDALSFMVIGDLSFFYDMNALRIRHIKKNVRILLLNNHGGEEFYYNGIWRNQNSDLHTTARHSTKAEGWVMECGFKYLSAHDKESYDKALPEFMDEQSEQPILFEVFSEMSEDAKKIYEFYDLSRPKDVKSEIMRHSKDLVRATIGSDKAKRIAEAFNIKL
jgi:2-succinyl-5-enolpyruvyl-6-hydroxy-3-cyclohexene-1-carboxylate synthase